MMLVHAVDVPPVIMVKQQAGVPDTHCFVAASNPHCSRPHVHVIWDKM
jgi:hypothetical protein